jgi:NitT/TauT family transport system ATP-binding protein
LRRDPVSLRVVASAAAAPFLSVTNLGKQYGSRPPVLHDLSLTARAGEFVSLLGASGCGKSTLLRAIAGLSSISSGAIRIDGRPPEAAREVMSFVFQDATLLPWRTAARNVELALELKGLPAPMRKARVEAVLELVGLSAVRQFYPRQLSGGMKMRVSIARALATTPQVLLMDEPFGALDELTRQRLNEELLALRQRQRSTTLFVTHSISEAVFLSDRILLMGANPGRVCEEIAVALPSTRTAELRNDAGFLQLVAQVGRRLAALSP